MGRPQSPPAMRRRSGGSFLLGMFVGVLIGLGISLPIAFYLNKGPMPFITAKPKQAEKDATAKSGPVAGLPQGTPAATPEKPKFDFYKILPGQEQPVSEKELREPARAPPTGQQLNAPERHFIQAG